MKSSWKTTSAGLGIILATVIPLVFAAINKTLTEAMCLAAIVPVMGGLGLIFARDNNRSSEQVGAGGIPRQADDPRQSKMDLVILIGICGIAGCVFMGCVYNRQMATSTATNPTNGVVTITKASSTTWAAGDGRASIEKTRASAGKTSTAGATGIGEEVTTGNLATNLNAAAGLINALKGP